MALPCELIDEILCRLSVKYLLRYRCVSKGWCSLIDSTPFIKKHLKRNLEGAGGRLLIDSGAGNFNLVEGFESNFDGGDDDDAVAVEIKDPLKTLLSGSCFVGAANGLVCVSKNRMNDVLIFNPSTRKLREIPSAPAEYPRSFHTTESSLCGFGYDGVNDDYKVVKIAEFYLQFRGIMAIVYSLKTNSWKRIQNVPTNTRFCGGRGMFASGALHWIAVKNPTKCREIIVGFDLGLEQFREVPFPAIKRPIVYYNTRFLISDGESLCFIDNYPNSHSDVWLMNIHSGAETLWSKALSVEQHGILGSFKFFRPVAVPKSGESVLLKVNVSGGRTKLVWYDLKRKTIKNVKIRGTLNKFDSHEYTESLIQLTKDKLLQRPSKQKPEKKQQKRRDDFLSKGFKLRL
ncbi:F-box domain-containing protein [Heracleum sosnowskyi]|uniref:F-box domain-containing protein n=1 Tax=Heracleum sosnowskyi TaxID=360622 RepID=A0AAD8MCZ5_9APIA|nr:F-box domain-containing protein [Heracleum sosnowskyi]